MKKNPSHRAEALEARLLLAALGVDLPNPDTASSSPSFAMTLGGQSFFVANDSAHGQELWVTDGTEVGTHLVKDIQPVTVTNSPAVLGAYRNKIYFTAESSQFNVGLWSTDGTDAGTVELKTFGSNRPTQLAVLNDTAYFTVSGKLWKTDGSTDGTVLVDDSVSYQPLSAATNFLYFSGSAPGLGTELWRTDGTAGGTFMLKDINAATLSSSPGDFTLFNGKFYFTATSGTKREIWTSDGTMAGTVRAFEGIDPISASCLTVLGNRVLFRGFTDTNRLWSSDGTAAGTQVIADFQPLVGGQNIVAPFATGGGLAYFAATVPGASGIWKTDGTAAGTTFLQAFNINNMGLMYGSGDVAMFRVASGEVGSSVELWKVDSTHAEPISTVFRAIGQPRGELNGQTLWNLTDGHGDEMWKLDESGTPALIKDINAVVVGSNPTSITNVNGKLFFTAFNRLWKSDGSHAGTVLLHEWSAIFGEGDGGLNLNDHFVFTNSNDRSLWTSDGTPQGTFVLKTFPFALQAGGKLHMIVLGDLALFLAEGNQLWRTDGTPEGTFLLKALTNIGLSDSVCFIKFGNSVYFATGQSSSSSALWKTDGTPEGTVVLNPAIYRSVSTVIPAAAVYNNLLYYAGCEFNSCRLWSTDGNSAGAAVPGIIISNPTNLTTAGNNLFMVSGGNTLVRYNAGSGFATLKQFTGTSAISNLIAYNGVLFFSYGNQLWRSEGSAATTAMVSQFAQNIPVFNPFKVGGGQLFLVVGNEVWKTNGMPTGEKKVTDHVNGAAGSRPLLLGEIDGAVWFRGATGPSLAANLFKLSPPIARSNAQGTIAIGASKALSAAASSDPDPGETLSFIWDLDNDGFFGETNASASHGDEIGATPTFFAGNLPPGLNPIALRVTNSFGLSSQTTSSIRIARVGDLNFDNQVSIADFIQLASHFGQSPATWEDGDLNDDGAVTIADFIMLASNFEQGSAGAATPQAALSMASAPVAKRKMQGRSKVHHHVGRVKPKHTGLFLERRLAEKHN